MEYRIDWNGGICEPCASLAEAVGILRSEYPEGLIGHPGDLEHGGDRTLAWAAAEDAEDDDGACTVAVIRRA